MADDRARVVITGMGAMTPLGETPEEYWQNLAAGTSGIGPMTLCDPEGYPCQISGEVSAFDPNTYIGNKEARRMARFTQLAVAAALQAVEFAAYDISKDDPYRVGVILGNGNGGFPTLEENCRILADRGGDAYVPLLLSHDPAQHGRRRREPLYRRPRL